MITRIFKKIIYLWIYFKETIIKVCVKNHLWRTFTIKSKKSLRNLLLFQITINRKTLLIWFGSLYNIWFKIINSPLDDNIIYFIIDSLLLSMLLLFLILCFIIKIFENFILEKVLHKNVFKHNLLFKLFFVYFLMLL